MSLYWFALRRIIEAIPVLAAVISLVFALISLAPGNVAMVLAGEHARADQAAVVAAHFGLNRPLVARWWDYMRAVARGDFGTSLAYDEPAITLVSQRIWPTLLLMLVAQAVGLAAGVSLGIFAAQRYGSRLDTILSGTSVVFFSLPVFWVGLIFIVVFAVLFHVLPTGGMTDLRNPTEGLSQGLDVLKHLVLPVFSLALVWTFPLYFRFTRSAVLDVLGEDYVRTAYAKGISRKRLMGRHVLRNAMLPVVAVAGVWLGLTFSGAVLTETVFEWPGLGRLMYESIFNRDYPVLIAVFTITATAVVIASVVADLLYAACDPRISYS